MRKSSETTTLKKGLEILSLFGSTHPVLNVSAIALQFGIPASTIYRYINTLKSAGMIEEDIKPGFYRLGLKILELARILRERLTIADIALPIMQQLREKTGETVLLLSIHGNKVICIEVVESNHLLRFSSGQGRTIYMHAGASGKVMMAHLDEAEQDRIIREEGLPEFTINTIIDPDRLKKELNHIRKVGFAVSSGELDLGARGIAAPILDKDGKLIAGLSLTGPLIRITDAKIDELSRLVMDAAKEISEWLGKIGRKI